MLRGVEKEKGEGRSTCLLRYVRRRRGAKHSLDRALPGAGAEGPSLSCASE